jgi:hypothetical protein
MNARNGSTHEVYEQLAAGHALSALEPEEELEFLAHLPSCAACERALADHSEALSHLAYGTESVEPPASLFEGIRAQIRAESPADLGDRLVAPTSLTAARERRARRMVPLSAALTGVAASLVLIVSLFVANLGLQDDKSDAEVRQEAFNKAVSQLLVPGARQVAMTGSGTAVAVVNGNQVSIVMSGLQATDKSSVYVLWGKSRFGGVSAVGTFDVRNSDLAVASGLRLDNPSTLEALMVTREQGRRAPPISTQAPVIVGHV